ncbi:hypothetical protein ACTXG6_30975 [Pseudonocardia sp. Cha107L01]
MVSVPVIGIAFGISLLVGVSLGAIRPSAAARLCPMDALRHW